MSSNTPKLIVLRTLPEHLDAVAQRQKHAQRGRLRAAQPGDILLIGLTGSGMVSYAMRFRGQHRDTSGESERTWGRRWKYIIEGDCWCELDRPFGPQDERITDVALRNYGPGGSFFYVLPEDAEAFRQRGLLGPLLPR